MSRNLFIKSMFVLTLLLLLIGSGSGLNAQISHGGKPWTFSTAKGGSAFFINVEYDEISLKAPDVEPLIAEDLANASKDLPLRVGVSLDADITMQNAGTWTDLPMGARLWTLKVRVQGAKALTLGFEDFHLAEGSKLFFYNENRKQVLGAFTSENNLENRTFAIEQVQGEVVCIEYYEPAFKKAGSTDKTTFRIFDVGYFYREFTDLKPYKDTQTRVQESESCEVDINCTPVGDDWQDEKRGVAQITLKSGGEWYVCTGSLINNTNSDGTPYFLTAFHCGEDNTTTAEFNQWIFKFKYEAPAAQASGHGTTITSEPTGSRSITGCTKKASGDISGGSDFLLLLLNSTPTAAYEPYYNGWSRSTTAPSNGVGIHHPAGDIKKISTYSSSSTGSYTGSARNAHWQLQWRQNDNGFGVTEGGSSGSPLFDSNGFVVGTLTGGSSYCTMTSGSDYYGKISYHWESNGNTNAKQLKPWLDPTNTGVTNCPGYDPFANQPPEPDFAASSTTILEGGSVDFYNYTMNNPVSYSWSFPGATPSSSTAQEPTGITYNTAGSYNVTLSASNDNGTNSVTKTDYINVINASGSFCDTVSQFGGSLANYYLTDSLDNLTGYLGGTNDYEDMTAWAEIFQSASPYNQITGFRFFPSVAKRRTNCNVTFNLWSLSSNLPDEVIASATIPLANVISAMNSDGYIDVDFGGVIDIPAGGFAVGWERPGAPASGDTLASYTNAEDGEMGTACFYYDGEWMMYSSVWGDFQFPMLPFVCYNGSLPPTADFTSDTRQVDVGESVNFYDISAGNVTSRSWTFEGGSPSTSTEENPVVTYSAPGSYQVSLTVTNATGSNTRTVDAYINVFDPNASSGSFSLDFEACGDFQVDNFHPWTTYDGDGAATYESSGFDFLNEAYTGSFIAFNSSATSPEATGWDAHGGDRCGICFASTTPPNNDWLISAPLTLCSNASISFWAKSITDNYGLERFNVLLSTTDNSTSSFTVKLSGNTYIQAPTTWTQYTYSLSAYAGRTVYVAIQCVSNDAYAFMIDDIEITGDCNSAPTADFMADNTTAEVGSTVSFTDLSTNMPTSWSWTFNGATPATSTVQNPRVTYNTPGTYAVSLTVTNAQGTDTETKAGYITVTPQSEVLVEWNFPEDSADATADGGISANLTKTISVGGGVGTITYTTDGASTLCANASGWRNGNNAKYWKVNFTTTGYESIKFWSKQSGVSTNNQSPKNFKVQYSLNNSTWTDVPDATVTCAANWTSGALDGISLPEACNNQANVYLRWIMTSNNAISGTVGRTSYSYIDDIVVKGIYMAVVPEAEFTADATSVCAGATVTFTDQSANNPTSWAWNFGDGATSTDQNPTHAYATAGTYTVTLVATNDFGEDTETKTNYITVNANPTVSIVAPQAYCAGETAQINATVSGATSYSWSGPNGYTASTQNVSIANATANNSGTYTITVTSATSCVATASVSLTVNTNPTLNVSNGGPYCEGATIALNANGNGGTAYSWSGPNGFTSNIQNPTIANADGDNAGTYTVTLTNTTTGCSVSAGTVVAVNALPTLNASNNGPYCEGSTITLSANGTGGTAYAWSGPNGYTANVANPTIANSTTANAGTYNVTLTNPTTGCSVEASTIVNVNANPVVTASNTGAYCAGQTIALSAVSSDATSFAWSGPNGYASAQQNPVIANAVTNNGGSYTVVATNANNCSAQASTVVTVNANPTANASNTGAYCEGQTIALQTTATGTYAWSGPNGFSSTLQNPTIANATDANAGTYTLVVSNANSCTAEATTVVVVNASPTVTASNTGGYCADQTIVLSLVSADATSFAWNGPNGFTSNVQNPEIANATPANGGTYTVVVTNANGCTANASTDVTVIANPIANASNTGAYCEGQTISLQTTATGTYVWHGPNGFISNTQNPTIENATLADAGVYTLSVINAGGCAAEASTTVVVNANPTVELGANQTVCIGETATLDAGAGLTYHWSTGAVTQTISAAAGDYYVTVYNANECSATDNISVANYPQTTLAMTSTAETGHNVADGTATVTPTGMAPFTYHWSNNGNTATISGLAGGNYSVTVTDGNGCVSTAIVNVATMDTPPVADFLVNNAENVAICLGAEVAFTDLSTNTPTQWAWNFGDGQTSNVQNPTHTYASAGNYTVSLTVTNQDGSDTKQITNCVVVNAVPTAIATNSGTYCAGETIELSVESDIAGEYQWTGPMGYNSTLQNPTRANATANYAGTYSVTVTTANGCLAVASTDVVVNANPVATITNNSGTTVLTCTTSSIQLVANGGVSYSWNGVAGEDEYTVTTADNYTVVVTNENNCTAEASITITADADIPTISIDGTSAYCEGATIALVANSSTSGTYSWTGPNGFSASTNTISIPNATADNDGIYTATFVAANGCEASNTISVFVNANPTVEISSNSPVCEGGDVTFSASSAETLNYSWSGPNGFASTEASPVISGATLANAGTYTLVVENVATGCANTFHAELMVNAAPTVSLGDDVTVCANVEATLNATAGFVSYTWNGEAGSQSFTATEAGDYTVVVADNNGCTASDVVTVNHYELPVLAMSSTPESGHGVSDGTASVEISGGTAPYAIIWNNNETTAQITGLTNGHYTVVVTDDNGCAVNGAVDVNSMNTPPIAAFTADVESGCAPLTVNFTDNSTNFPQTWTWDFDGTTSSEQNPSHIFSEPGTYNVYLTVSNLDGNDIATKVITVYANPTVIVPEINQSIICEGSSSEITVFDEPNISYEWSNGFTESTTVVSEAGVYTLTITDEHGCTATASFEMTMAPVPEVSLGTDIDVCENSEAEINAGEGYAWYNWSTGETTQSIMVSAAGEYSVTVFNEYGCEASDTIAVSILAAPTFAISDTSACVNEEIVLSVDTEDEVLWFGETEGNTYAQTYPYAGEYLVWVTVSNGECETTDTITVTVETCTSVDEMSAMEIQLYPNPVRDMATFTVTGYEGAISYIVVDLSGREMTFETVSVDNESVHTVDVSNLVSGVYILRITTDSEVHNIKFTKE